MIHFRTWNNRSVFRSDPQHPSPLILLQAELKERISEVDDDSVDSPEPPPAVPRRMVGVVRPTSIASEATIHRRSATASHYENVVKKDRKIFETIGVERKPAVALDGDVLAFIDMIRQLRAEFRAEDGATNPGVVTAVKLHASYPPHTEVKLEVDSVVFTAAIDTDLAAITAQVLVKLDREAGGVDQYTLKIFALQPRLLISRHLQVPVEVREQLAELCHNCGVRYVSCHSNKTL